MVFQDFSFDCESLKCCLIPHDIRVVSSVTRKVMERLQLVRTSENASQAQNKSSQMQTFVPPFVRFKKKGSGIATRIRAELQTFSIVLMYAFKRKTVTRPFFEFYSHHLKGRLEGVAAALSGELSTLAILNFFNPVVADWENVVEPFRIVVAIEQMPNELVSCLGYLMRCQIFRI